MTRVGSPVRLRECDYKSAPATCNRPGAWPTPRRGDDMKNGTRIEWFWQKVDKTDDCWNWVGHTAGNGYGRFRMDGGMKAAHRVAYEALVGPIPEGLELDHLCSNRACVNPDHLEPVTHRANVMRGDTVTAANARKTHCKHGHEFTPDNTYVQSSGGRGCRACRARCDRQRAAR